MKLERRKFLQIMGAAVVVCAAGGLTGCGKNVKKLVLGDWYMSGNDYISFSIYDDGTSKIRGDYGLGKWSVQNDELLILSDFYGQTRTYKIKDIDKKSMTTQLVFDEHEGATDTFYHTAEEALQH